MGGCVWSVSQKKKTDGNSVKASLEHRLRTREISPKRRDWHKIDYSAVAAKSRCVAGLDPIARFFNNLCWSGRRDSNPRPSAPKADALPGCATPRHIPDCIADCFRVGPAAVLAAEAVCQAPGRNRARSALSTEIFFLLPLTEIPSLISRPGIPRILAKAYPSDGSPASAIAISSSG